MQENTLLPYLWKNLPSKSLVNSKTAQSQLLPRSKGPQNEYHSLISSFHRLVIAGGMWRLNS